MYTSTIFLRIARLRCGRMMLKSTDTRVSSDSTTLWRREIPAEFTRGRLIRY